MLRAENTLLCILFFWSEILLKIEYFKIYAQNQLPDSNSFHYAQIRVLCE